MFVVSAITVAVYIREMLSDRKTENKIKQPFDEKKNWILLVGQSDSIEWRMFCDIKASMCNSTSVKSNWAYNHVDRISGTADCALSAC